MNLQVKRIHDPPEPSDGRRILVDRLWPRGVSKENAALDEWAKEVTPSNELRKAYHTERINHAEFVRRYHEELDEQSAALSQLRAVAEDETVTLLTATRDPDQSHVAVLLAVLEAGSS